MRTRSVLAVSLSAVVAAGALAPALAAPPKTVKKTYTATAFPPDPTHITGGGICNTTNPASQHNEPFTVPFAGTLVVDMKGFQGDWDLALYNGTTLVAQSAQSIEEPVDKPEKMTVKLKKVGQKLSIRACNFAGGPTATVSYVHTAAAQ